MEFHKPELLVVVFEVGGPLAVEAALLTFCHAHLLGHRQNQIALFAALAGTSEVVYPDGASRAGDAATADFAGFDRVVSEKMRQLETGRAATRPAIASALSRALCFIARQTRGGGAGLAARVLIVQQGADAPAQYNAMMNCIFAAHSRGVLIDGCVLASESSTFLQQAAHHTNGVYLQPPQPQAR